MGAGRLILSRQVDWQKVKVDRPIAPGAKITNDRQFRERVHRFDGAGETAEPAGDDHPGSHGWHSGSVFAADVDGVSYGKGLPAAADGVRRIIGSGGQYPDRYGSSGVNRYISGRRDTHGNSVVGGVQRLHGAKERFALPADQFPVVAGVDLGTVRYPYTGGDLPVESASADTMRLLRRTIERTVARSTRMPSARHLRGH